MNVSSGVALALAVLVAVSAPGAAPAASSTGPIVITDVQMTNLGIGSGSFTDFEPSPPGLLELTRDGVDDTGQLVMDANADRFHETTAVTVFAKVTGPVRISIVSTVRFVEEPAPGCSPASASATVFGFSASEVIYDSPTAIERDILDPPRNEVFALCQVVAHSPKPSANHVGLPDQTDCGSPVAGVALTIRVTALAPSAATCPVSKAETSGHIDWSRAGTELRREGVLSVSTGVIDLSGTMTADLPEGPLSLSIGYDDRGRLRGTGTLAGELFDVSGKVTVRRSRQVIHLQSTTSEIRFTLDGFVSGNQIAANIAYASASIRIGAKRAPRTVSLPLPPPATDLVTIGYLLTSSGGGRVDASFDVLGLGGRSLLLEGPGRLRGDRNGPRTLRAVVRRPAASVSISGSVSGDGLEAALRMTLPGGIRNAKFRISATRPSVALAPTFDEADAVSAPAGPFTPATLETTGSDGTVYRLDIGQGVVQEDTTITMTPVTAIDNLPDGLGFEAAVRIDPPFLQFVGVARLTITLPHVVPAAETAGFTFVPDPARAGGTSSGTLGATPLQPNGTGGTLAVSLTGLIGALRTQVANLTDLLERGILFKLSVLGLDPTSPCASRAIIDDLRFLYFNLVKPAAVESLIDDTLFERAAKEHYAWLSIVSDFGKFADLFDLISENETRLDISIVAAVRNEEQRCLEPGQYRRIRRLLALAADNAVSGGQLSKDPLVTSQDMQNTFARTLRFHVTGTIDITTRVQSGSSGFRSDTSDTAAVDSVLTYIPGSTSATAVIGDFVYANHNFVSTDPTACVTNLTQKTPGRIQMGAVLLPGDAQFGVTFQFLGGPLFDGGTATFAVTCNGQSKPDDVETDWFRGLQLDITEPTPPRVVLAHGDFVNSFTGGPVQWHGDSTESGVATEGSTVTTHTIHVSFDLEHAPDPSN